MLEDARLWRYPESSQFCSIESGLLRRHTYLLTQWQLEISPNATLLRRPRVPVTAHGGGPSRGRPKTGSIASPTGPQHAQSHDSSHKAYIETRCRTKRLGSPI